MITVIKHCFTPNEADPPANALMSRQPYSLTKFNTIFTDITARSYVDQKKVFEQALILLKAGCGKSWKITDETREIAGYTCRRANGIYLDSIYVVGTHPAAYRYQVWSRNLFADAAPGMILGVALPHENITWFATKIIGTYVADNTLAAPKKGKATNEKDLENASRLASKAGAELA